MTFLCYRMGCLAGCAWGWWLSVLGNGVGGRVSAPLRRPGNQVHTISKMHNLPEQIA